MKKRFTSVLLASGLLFSIGAPAMAADAAEIKGTYKNGTVTITGNLDDDYSMIRIVDTKDDNKMVATGTSGEGGEINISVKTGALTKEKDRYKVWINGSTELLGDGYVEFSDDTSSDKPSGDNSGSSGNRRPSSGGSSSSGRSDRPALKIKADDHGDVTVSPRNPEKGQKVTITVKPDSGYILDELKVTVDGKEVSLTEKGDNVFTFTMPGDDVVVSATFKPGNATPTLPERSHFFYDVSSTDWFAAAVAFVSENGMMAGNNNKFSPNDRLTRGMMAQILYNLDGGSGSGSGYFPDVSPSDWFARAVAWASSQSLMDGYGSGNFGPNDPITREQLASILYRYASAKGYNTGASGDLSAFADGANTSSWASASVRWAVGSGLLSGKSGNRLDPAGAATRAEVAQILMNFHTQVAD